jgi:hypothetical protein
VDQRRIDSGRGPRGQRRATGRGSAFQATGDLATATEANGEEQGEGNGGKGEERGRTCGGDSSDGGQR